ncbi:MAG: DUF1993 family protein [Bacteriovoracia bacterium]
MYNQLIPPFIKSLKNLETIMEQGQAHAIAKKIDMTVLLNARLIADQFPLLRQIQIACDTAKLGAARLSGKEAPVHDDKEATWPELKTRIHQVIAFLESMKPQDFAGAEERKITQPRWEGKWMTGEDYLRHHAIPNIYFHVTTAYSILRANGVDVGKKTYLGEMPYKH